MLLVAPTGSDLDAVADTTGLIRRFNGSEIAAMADFLADAIRGKTPTVKNTTAYAWPTLATTMDQILRATTAQPSYVLNDVRH